jgi:hypothetical protein
MESVTQHQDRASPAPTRLRAILWFLLFLAAAEFVLRGPVRFLSWPAEWNDLSQNYTASKLWLKGQNPSDPRNFVALWKREVGSRLDPSDIRTHSAPPPGTLVIMAPIATFPWPIAKILWLCVLLISFASAVWSLIQVAGLRDDPFRTLAFITGCLALAPFHTGISCGNASILVIGVCVTAISAASSQREVTAGLLFGLACSLKPHVGSFLVLYYLLHRRWRLFVTALAFTAGLALTAILWMQICGVSWAKDYFHNVRLLATQNRIDDFTSNSSRFTLINLQVPLYSFAGSARSANILAWSIGAFLICGCTYLITQRSKCRSELLPLGTIAVIGLLPVYHRLYDASLLAIPLCWCVSQPAGKFKNVTLIELLFMSPFLVPGAALLQQLAAHGHVPVAWMHSWWWDRIVMPHETWMLLLLCLVLLYEIKMHLSGACRPEDNKAPGVERGF